MADDLNRLLIKIQADTSQLSSALQRAEAGVAQSSQRIERTLVRNSNKFKKWGDDIGRQFKGLVAGYLGIEVGSKALDAVKLVAALDGQAKAAGLTTDQFQELAFAASQVDVSTEELSQGLDKFSVSMAQVRLNTGAFNQFLKDQAPALRDALAATTSQEAAVKVLSNAMAGLGDDSQRATLLQQAFGDSSRKLVSVLSDGSRALDDAAQKAHEFGIVITDEDIKAAKEAAAEFAKLEFILTTTFEKAAISAYSFGKSVTDALAHPLQSLGDLLDKMHSVSGAAMGGVGARGRSPLAIANDQGGTSLDLFAPKATGWDATVNKAPSWSLRPKPDNTGRNALASLTQQFDQSNGNIQQALQDQYDQELRQWQDMLDKKQISEAQFAEARTQLGIVMLNTQKENLGAETQLQKEYYGQLQGLIGSTFMDTFSNALQSGKFKAAVFFNSLLQGFAKITTEVLILKPLLNSLFSGVGGGGLSSILNGLIGVPARAAGGPGNSGQPYLVGEHGPEIFTPSSNGSFGGSGVYARGNAGGNVTNNYVDARGADTGVADRLSKLFNSQRQQSPVMAVRQAAKRFPNRG